MESNHTLQRRKLQSGAIIFQERSTTPAHDVGTPALAEVQWSIQYYGEQSYSPEKKTTKWSTKWSTSTSLCCIHWRAIIPSREENYKDKAAAITQILGWKDKQFQNIKNL